MFYKPPFFSDQLPSTLIMLFNSIDNPYSFKYFSLLRGKRNDRREEEREGEGKKDKQAVKVKIVP